ncbi:sulfurtransferase TusA family protein [Ferrigenium sp. UT5]|uniref:sulfurtransferase TusA family protein n=1 Tax=Ferrigenium sp. UT5 TaxID=3242105 RepID=UPI003551DEEA
MSEFDAELDVRRLACPLPILRTKKALAEMPAGQVLRVVATDRGALKDFPDFCAKTGHELISAVTLGEEFVFLIRRR